MANPRWGIALRGSDADLADWRLMLKPPFDPWVEQRTVHGQDVLVLFAAILEEATSAVDARQMADVLVGRAIGAIALSGRDTRVAIAGVVDDGDGGPVLHTFATGSAVLGPLQVSATGTVRNPDGSIPAPAPQALPVASLAQLWLNAGATDHVEELLVYAGRADNWFDLYKLIEVSEAIYGGEHALRKACPDIKAAKATANIYRHSRAKGHLPPSNLLTFKDVKARAFHVAGLALEHSRKACGKM